MKNLKLLSPTEKTLAVLDEIEKTIARLEGKYQVAIKYNIDDVRDTRKREKKLSK